MAYRVRIGQRTFFGLRGNVHLHTSLSDGTLDHEALAHLAAEEGLDFIIITDHNVYPPGRDAWIGKTLLLVGGPPGCDRCRAGPGRLYLSGPPL